MVGYKSGELLLNFVIKCLSLIRLLQFCLSIRYFQSLIKATAMLNNFLHLLYQLIEQPKSYNLLYFICL